ncbi:uncharacterized protein PG998_010614 [Apiospora kogelbergensis]|uniref:uncharacterized protein n=1 Tax=Apiospora kogelbergensis TaxID=1337665 RepID=UPI00312D290F
MTSCEWQPGNIYSWEDGSDHQQRFQPRYNAITYTWGRFAYRCGVSDEAGYETASYLSVGGITWSDFMPRMRDRFTPTDLKKVITAATEGDVEFVWLDIACINQALDSSGERLPVYFEEIGRQAVIFGGATQVFVWLHGFSHRHLQDWWAEINRVVDDASNLQFDRTSDKSSLRKLLPKLQHCLDTLIRDDWFSSLWTLQEAFLSPDAAILSRESSQIWMRVDQGRSKRLLRLMDISLLWNIVCHVLYTHRQNWPEAEVFKQRLREKIGFLEAVQRQKPGYYLHAGRPDLGNPFALLIASHHRTVRPENQNDRVYGIMQIYDLKLGKSSPFYRGDRNYTLEELKDQLAAALITKYPVASQLIIQSKGCPEWKAWRVNSAMSLPEEAFIHWKLSVSRQQQAGRIEEYGTRVKLTPYHHKSLNSLLIRFEGLTITLDEFARVLSGMGSDDLNTSQSLLDFGPTPMFLDDR